MVSRENRKNGSPAQTEPCSCGPAPEGLPRGAEWPQLWGSMDLSEYDPEMIEIKRAAEAEGRHVWIPKRGASRWELPEPIDFGESLGDIVIRQRGREP